MFSVSCSNLESYLDAFWKKEINADGRQLRGLHTLEILKEETMSTFAYRECKINYRPTTFNLQWNTETRRRVIEG